jgi:hypothetical protein
MLSWRSGDQENNPALLAVLHTRLCRAFFPMLYLNGRP